MIYEKIKECYEKGIFDECSDWNFTKYAENNPLIIEWFNQFTLEAIKNGSTKISAELIVNRIRWELQVVTREDDKYKINNNAKPFLARLFQYMFPEYKHIFNTRATNKGGKDEQY